MRLHPLPWGDLLAVSLPSGRLWGLLPAGSRWILLLFRVLFVSAQTCRDLWRSYVSKPIPHTLLPALSLPEQLLLQMNPSHVDSLLQLSDVCRMQEDQEMARDLIGKTRQATG